MAQSKCIFIKFNVETKRSVLAYLHLLSDSTRISRLVCTEQFILFYAALMRTSEVASIRHVLSESKICCVSTSQYEIEPLVLLAVILLHFEKQN